VSRFAFEPAELERRAQAIRLVLLDVDGVLTDGRLAFADGDVPGVSFHIQDGLGLKLLQRAGLEVGLLSGRASAAVERRARDLGLDHTILGRVDKGVALTELLERIGMADHELAFAGDDLPDLAVLARCGLGFAPADAVAEVQGAAHVRLERRGGNGAVRELVELLLGWRGVWPAIVDQFRR
jgi:3-deoxy-D-manno-octulosonate 8-phosphate phosphatase (KDO 8-P phosphatase)